MQLTPDALEAEAPIRHLCTPIWKMAAVNTPSVHVYIWQTQRSFYHSITFVYFPTSVWVLNITAGDSS